MLRHVLVFCLALFALARGVDALAALPASMISPANGATLTGSSQTFRWDAPSGASIYQLWIGNSVGSYDIGYFPPAGTSVTTLTVDGLPTDERTLYVRLWTAIDGTYYFRDFTYLASSTAAIIGAPANGATLDATTQLFQWNAIPQAVYQLWVGSSPGTYDVGYFPAGLTSDNSITASGLPFDGRTLYVRLWTAGDDAYQFRDFTYTAATPWSAASITSPAPGSVLAYYQQVFSWGDAGTDLYQIWVGSAAGAYDLGYSTVSGTASRQATFSNLPFDGRTVYVRLWSAKGGLYEYNDYVYTAGARASLTSPLGGSTLGSSQTFQWNDAHADFYLLVIGTIPGGFDVRGADNVGRYLVYGTSITLNGLPAGSSPLYVQLITRMSLNGLQHEQIGVFTRDYVFTSAPPSPASILFPENGARLAGDTQTFQWNSPPGATRYQVWVGNSVGAYDLGYFPAAGTTEAYATVAGLPTDGRTLYVRLWSLFQGTYYFNDFTYVAAASAGPGPAELTMPTIGATLAGATDAFRWSAAPGAAAYQLWVGSSIGAYDIGYFPQGGTTETSVTATGLPNDGRTLYVRLWSSIGGVYAYRDYSYVASAPGDPIFRMPTLGAALPGPVQVFRWAWGSYPQSTTEKLWIGNNVGGDEFGRIKDVDGRATFFNLPIDGRALFARLAWTRDGVVHFRDYAFTAAAASPAAVMLSPPTDYEASGPPIFGFRWSDAVASSYMLWVGSTLGGQEYGVFPPGGTTSTSLSVTLPYNYSSVLYVRLWSQVGGVWYYRDYNYLHGAA